MEQNGISIISPPGVTENSVGKSKSIGITLRSNSTLQSVKEKLKTPWFKKTEESSTLDKVRAVLGELIGTAILIFLGCTACLGSMPLYTESGPPVLQIGFAFGLAVMIAIQCVGHISGAFLNPAITLAALILGKKTLMMAGLYAVAQCFGAVVGFGLLKAITPENLIHDGISRVNATPPFCMTDINEKFISSGRGIATEALATGIFTFFACSSWDSRNAKNSDSLALKFGLCITALCFAFISHTGCSMNPARTFGPAVWNRYWEHHWIYWLGPLGGALITAVIYRCLFSPKKNQENTMQDGEL